MNKNENLLRKLSDITTQDDDWVDEAKFLVENNDWLDDSLQIASLILVRLRKIGWKQVDLATAMGVKPQQVNKWIKGQENFRLSTIKKLEKALGTTLIQVYGQKSKRSSGSSIVLSVP